MKKLHNVEEETRIKLLVRFDSDVFRAVFVSWLTHSIDATLADDPEISPLEAALHFCRVLQLSIEVVVL